jgi:hypothetical protein
LVRIGDIPDTGGRRVTRTLPGMPQFVLWHHHEPDECRTAFAAWRGFDSPLRGASALASCLTGRHTVCWTLRAESRADAHGLLPAFVAARTEVVEVREITIP